MAKYRGRILKTGEIVLARHFATVRATGNAVEIRTPSFAEQGKVAEFIQTIDLSHGEPRLTSTKMLDDNGSVVSEYACRHEKGDVTWLIMPQDGREPVPMSHVSSKELEMGMARNMALILEAARSPEASPELERAKETLALHLFKTGSEGVKNQVFHQLKQSKDFPLDGLRESAATSSLTLPSQADGDSFGRSSQQRGK